jgi:LAGLIDADG endonuclease
MENNMSEYQNWTDYNRLCDYFAGFVDGEGYFHINKSNVEKGITYSCRFDINLRDDDDEIIKLFHDTFKIGVVNYYSANRETMPNANPQVVFRIAKLTDCLKLIEIFDNHPLRAKKKKDYEIWKQAVLYHQEHSSGGRRGGHNSKEYIDVMENFKITLQNIKIYNSKNEGIKNTESLNIEGSVAVKSIFDYSTE